MIRIMSLLFITTTSGVALAAEWESQTEIKYMNSTPSLYQKFEEARNILDSWRGESEKLSRAWESLDYVLDTDEYFAPAYVELGRLYIMSGYVNGDRNEPKSLLSAEMAIKKAIEIEPNYADAYVLLGHLYTNMNKHEDARVALERGESLGSESPWLQLNWAELLKKQGQIETAFNRYRTVIDSNTQNKKAYGAALEGMISYYVAKDDLAAADAWHTKKIAYDPSSAWAWGNYASFLLYRRGDVDGAIENAEKALSIMNYGMGRFTLACALYTKWAQEMERGNMGLSTRAVFERAYQLYPDLESVVSTTARAESTRVAAVQIKKFMKVKAANTDNDRQ